jgi:dATP pyrophosphohydrolase
MSCKRPESVLIVIHTNAGECLLLRRVAPEDFWQSVTGSLKWGEDVETAAARELFEETGFAAEHLQREDLTFEFPIIEPWKQRYAPGTQSNHETVFSLRFERRKVPVLNPKEHVEAIWLPKMQAMERVSSWTNREAIALIVAD